MVWRRQDLSSFLCQLMQRGCLCSWPRCGSVPSLCKAFPSSHMESPVERELSQGAQTNFSHSPSSLLPFLSPQLLTAALPGEGEDLGCRDCLSGLPVTPCLLLPCNPTPASPKGKEDRGVQQEVHGAGARLEMSFSH